MKLYLFVNTYTGKAKWLPLEEGLALDGYWEQDLTQAPFDCDKWYESTISTECFLIADGRRAL